MTKMGLNKLALWEAFHLERQLQGTVKNHSPACDTAQGSPFVFERKNLERISPIKLSLMQYIMKWKLVRKTVINVTEVKMSFELYFRLKLEVFSTKMMIAMLNPITDSS